MALTSTVTQASQTGMATLNVQVFAARFPPTATASTTAMSTSIANATRLGSTDACFIRRT
jgi:hypothetical protein